MSNELGRVITEALMQSADNIKENIKNLDKESTVSDVVDAVIGGLGKSVPFVQVNIISDSTIIADNNDCDICYNDDYDDSDWDDDSLAHICSSINVRTDVHYDDDDDSEAKKKRLRGFLRANSF